jgi:hypothetical protein
MKMVGIMRGEWDCTKTAGAGNRPPQPKARLGDADF